MNKRFPYWLWLVGVCVVWVIVLLIVSQNINADRFHRVLIFFAGFIVGVLAASIARKVYE